MRILQNAILILVLAALAGCASKQTQEKPPATDTNPSRVAPVTDNSVTNGINDSTGISGDEISSTVPRPATMIVYFDYDRSEMRTEARAILEDHSRYLIANPSINVRLEGHADERGSREYNLALGERRAESVRQLLGILGVSLDRMVTLSYGEEQPLDPNSNESAWQRNRRVEIVYP